MPLPRASPVRIASTAGNGSAASSAGIDGGKRFEASVAAAASTGSRSADEVFNAFHEWLEWKLGEERAFVERVTERRHEALLSDAWDQFFKLPVTPAALRLAQTGEEASASTLVANNDDANVTPPQKLGNNDDDDGTAVGGAASAAEAEHVSNEPPREEVEPTLPTEPVSVSPGPPEPVLDLHTTKKPDAEDEQLTATDLWLHRFFVSPASETLFGMIILLNAAVLALEIQYDGMESAHMIQYDGADERASTRWPYAEEFFFRTGRMLRLHLSVRTLGQVHIPPIPLLL
eukprot:NODE_1071_length_2621_cov_6.621091.p1 GENE.NODE_1071_length_2621_cov_6.621091~~NODE_1071_length_2621_cov_6.621091.p1  ORF type:complete len:289 (+),score=54.79 NODE_1071_length_2621_cov_6.621091:91-957(+)